MPDDSLTPRRDFLRVLSVGSTIAAVAGIEGCASAAARANAAVPPRPSTKWDLSWVDRLRAPYRIVFNVTQKGELPLMQAAMWMDGYRQAYDAKDTDLNAVLVFRHEAVTMLLGDDMWERLAITPSSGMAAARADTTMAQTPRRNPWLVGAGSGTSSTGSPGYSIRELMSRGVIMVGCGIALRGQTSRLRQKENLTEAAAEEATRAALVSGAYIAPNGIFAVARAQDVGCGYFVPG